MERLWVKCLISPVDHGWEIHDDNIGDQLDSSKISNRINELQKDMECCCVQAKLKYTDLYKTKCDNMSNENKDSFSDDEDSDLEDDI